MMEPKRSFDSVVEELIEGLREGSIHLDDAAVGIDSALSEAASHALAFALDLATDNACNWLDLVLAAAICEDNLKRARELLDRFAGDDRRTRELAQEASVALIKFEQLLEILRSGDRSAGLTKASDKAREIHDDIRKIAEKWQTQLG